MQQLNARSAAHTAGPLSQAQIEAFWRDGYLVAPAAASAAQLGALRQQFAAWVEESREHDGAYGEGLDGRPRFDVEAGHRHEHPALRRVNAPTEVSGAYLDVVRDSAMTDMVAQLIGPDVRHHHNKINSKLPGAATAVKWHQDFTFTPHTNADLVTALLMVDEVTVDNGPLEVAPGSHRGPLHSLWHEGRFTGAVAQDIAADFARSPVQCTGAAGSVCLMHTRLAHGSAPNCSSDPRTLFISVYAAADAIACSPNPVPSEHAGLLVRGNEPGRIRCEAYELSTPEFPKTTSFFNQQAAGRGGAAN